MAAEAAGSELVKVVALLGAAVVMVPLFRRLGLGSVLGYLTAGLLIGPSAWAGSPSRRRSSMSPNWAWSCSCS